MVWYRVKLWREYYEPTRNLTAIQPYTSMWTYNSINCRFHQPWWLGVTTHIFFPMVSEFQGGNEVCRLKVEIIYENLDSAEYCMITATRVILKWIQGHTQVVSQQWQTAASEQQRPWLGKGGDMKSWAICFWHEISFLSWNPLSSWRSSIPDQNRNTTMGSMCKIQN